MIPDALDFILRPTQDEQAEYAAAHKTPAPEPEGEASAGAGQTPASLAPSLQGEAGPHSSDADAVGAPASEVQTPAAEHRQERCPSRPVRSVAGGPRWSVVDDERGSLLDLLGDDGSWLLDDWPFFRGVLKKVATDRGGLIDQNIVRPLLRGEIKPQRIGALYRRAAKEGLIRRDGWTTTDHSESGNTGRPAPAYRWLGTT